ncbi:pyridoxamine 5'-phosphate oxidase family protein [Dysgonomonas sp. OttesenSCG-928-M03]|nr:pyridoxamine 5'-phosphate oxidase family protein [Dysgonomonas sp. OttesenSCG-928-M03]
MFREIRRKNRELTGERVNQLLKESEYGFLSLGTSDNGYAYGIPISYAYDEIKNILYFHCAPEGHKLDNIEKNNHLSFCVVGKTLPVADKYTTLYESVIVFGEAAIIDSDEEKRMALRLLLEKYSIGFEEVGEKYISGSWNRTQTFKLLIQHITAKAKY